MRGPSTAVRLAAVFITAGLASVIVEFADGETSAPTIRVAVVVGRNSVVTSVSEDTLRDVYLRRQRLWPDGTRTVPVNWPAGNSVRERFSRSVLGRSTQELVPYWNARYFEGITPPIVLPSAEAIRAYLNAEPGSIAYLPTSDVDQTCRTLLWLTLEEP